MKKIAVIYWSATGNTESMAGFVAEGAEKAGASVKLFTASEFQAAMVSDYDAFALGCPSMGAEVLEETEFEPLYLGLKPLLAGKKVGLFGSYGWGDGEWMRNWQADCEEAGISVAGEPVIVCGLPEGEGQEACKALGALIAAD